VEEVSVYDIVEHTDYKFRLGGIVLSLTKNDVGEVLELCGDSLRVYWSNKTITLEKATTLTFVDTDEDDISFSDVRTDKDDLDLETETDDGSDEEEESNDQQEGSKVKSRTKETKERNTTKKMTSTHGHKNTNVQNDSPEESEKEKEEITQTPSPPVTIQSHPEQTQPSIKEQQTQSQHLSEEQIQDTLVPSFGVLDELYGHHFEVIQDVSPKIGRVAMKEWKTFQSVLPKDIFVVSYSQRMDLLKVLIIGPQNTIYYNSYFIFDICLPSNYPNSPPKVFYHSGGYRLHPNLYEDGTVCLSLLGTWSGDQVERWIPNQSNVLQLVISLQGLILGVKEPYFLEAGYDKQKGTKQGIQSSKIYNEKALLLSLKRMLQHFQNPPPEFKDVIIQHFRQNYYEAVKLLEYCQSLLESNDNQNKEEFSDVKYKYYLDHIPSKGFLHPMVKDVKQKFEAITIQMTTEPK